MAGFSVINAVFAHRLAEAVRDAAMDLAMDDHRVDGAANIVDGAVAYDLDDTGIGVDLDLTDMAAIRKAGEIDGFVAFSGEWPVQIVGQVVAPQCLGRDLEYP